MNEDLEGIKIEPLRLVLYPDLKMLILLSLNISEIHIPMK